MGLASLLEDIQQRRRFKHSDKKVYRAIYPTGSYIGRKRCSYKKFKKKYESKDYKSKYAPKDYRLMMCPVTGCNKRFSDLESWRQHMVDKKDFAHKNYLRYSENKNLINSHLKARKKHKKSSKKKRRKKSGGLITTSVIYRSIP